MFTSISIASLSTGHTYTPTTFRESMSSQLLIKITMISGLINNWLMVSSKFYVCWITISLVTLIDHVQLNLKGYKKRNAIISKEEQNIELECNYDTTEGLASTVRIRLNDTIILEYNDNPANSTNGNRNLNQYSKFIYLWKFFNW